MTFARISGDTNPIHLDEDYARTHAPFGGRIVHGLLVASLLSTLFGTRFPGNGAIYLSQSLRFRAPVHLGDTVVARAVVVDVDDQKNRVRFDCECLVDEKVVLDGEAILLVPRRPATTAVVEEAAGA